MSDKYGTESAGGLATKNNNIEVSMHDSKAIWICFAIMFAVVFMLISFLCLYVGYECGKHDEKEAWEEQQILDLMEKYNG